MKLIKKWNLRFIGNKLIDFIKQLVYNILYRKKKEKEVMARPREIDFKNGTVFLQNFPPDVANKLEEYLLKFDTPASLNEVSTPAPGLVMPLPSPGENLTDKAIGFRLNPLTARFELVTVSYNASTKEAQVTEVKDAGSERPVAASDFRQEIVKLRLY